MIMIKGRPSSYGLVCPSIISIDVRSIELNKTISMVELLPDTQNVEATDPFGRICDERPVVGIRRMSRD